MILVTGATGFVGRGLVSFLQSQGEPVRAAVRTAAHRGVAVGDIGPDTNWSVALAGVETIVHLAARVHVMKETVADPDAAFDRINVDGSLALARQAVAAGVRRLIYVSSIKVNGEYTQPGRPYRADDRPAPVDPYGRSKAKAEAALRELALATGLELVIVRPPLVYGSGVGGNFSALIGLVDRGIPLPFGAIENKRSMVGLANLHSLLLKAARHPQAPGRTFLVSDDQDISTPALVRLIGGALGRTPVLVAVPPVLIKSVARLVDRRGAVQRLLSSLQLDISDTKSVLGWVPGISMEASIAAAVEARRRLRGDS